MVTNSLHKIILTLFQKMHQMCIKYPCNATSLILGTLLFTEDHHVYLYCLKDIHSRLAHTTPLDLDLASIGLASEVRVLDTIDLLGQMDYVVFPTLDMIPTKKCVDFARTLKDLFTLV